MRLICISLIQVHACHVCFIHIYGFVHTLSEVGAKEREKAARAELEAKDSAVAAGSTRLTPTTREQCASVHILRAKLQGRVLVVQGKIRATLEDLETKVMFVLHLFEA